MDEIEWLSEGEVTPMWKWAQTKATISFEDLKQQVAGLSERLEQLWKTAAHVHRHEELEHKVTGVCLRLDADNKSIMNLQDDVLKLSEAIKVLESWPVAAALPNPPEIESLKSEITRLDGSKIHVDWAKEHSVRLNGLVAQVTELQKKQASASPKDIVDDVSLLKLNVETLFKRLQQFDEADKALCSEVEGLKKSLADAGPCFEGDFGKQLLARVAKLEQSAPHLGQLIARPDRVEEQSKLGVTGLDAKLTKTREICNDAWKKQGEQIEKVERAAAEARQQWERLDDRLDCHVRADMSITGRVVAVEKKAERLALEKANASQFGGTLDDHGRRIKVLEERLTATREGPKQTTAEGSEQPGFSDQQLRIVNLSAYQMDPAHRKALVEQMSKPTQKVTYVVYDNQVICRIVPLVQNAGVIDGENDPSGSKKALANL